MRHCPHPGNGGYQTACGQRRDRGSARRPDRDDEAAMAADGHCTQLLREHMADYAEMSALGLWNDTITLESIMDAITEKKAGSRC